MHPAVDRGDMGLAPCDGGDEIAHLSQRERIFVAHGETTARELCSEAILISIAAANDDPGIARQGLRKPDWGG